LQPLLLSSLADEIGEPPTPFRTALLTGGILWQPGREGLEFCVIFGNSLDIGEIMGYK
jgi:hypothetical protein